MDDTGADIPSCSQPPLITRVSASQPIAANVVQTETPARSSVAGRRRALEMFRKKSKASETTPSKSQLATQAIIDEKEQNMNFQKLKNEREEQEHKLKIEILIKEREFKAQLYEKQIELEEKKIVQEKILNIRKKIQKM